MERFDNPMQSPSSAKRPLRRSTRSPFGVTGVPGAMPERLAVSSALVPVLFGILLLWNWRFALALLAGSFTMNAGFALQSPKWQRRWQRARRRLPDGYRLSLLLAVSGGTIATLGTYTAICMWMAGGDRWLTIGALAQGVVSFGILCLLGLQTCQQSTQSPAQSLEQSLQGIASSDPVARLLAVQRLNQVLVSGQATGEQQQLALDCLRLASREETEPEVRTRMLQILNLCAVTRG